MTQPKSINVALKRLGLSCQGGKSSLERTIVEKSKEVFRGTERAVWQWLRTSGRLPYEQPPSVRQTLARARSNPDAWVCRIVYRKGSGQQSERIISPVRFANEERNVVALCLGREGVRVFCIRNITDIALVDAATVLMGAEPVKEDVTT